MNRRPISGLCISIPNLDDCIPQRSGDLAGSPESVRSVKDESVRGAHKRMGDNR
jgi:hypothetical protein